MNKLEALLVDIDDTITDHKKSRKNSLIHLCNTKGIIYDDSFLQGFMDFDDKFWKEWEEGKITYPNHIVTSEDEINWARAQRFMINFNVDFKQALELNEIYSIKSLENIIPLDDAEEVIKYLSSKYKLFIATNGPLHAVEHKLKGVNVLECFTDVFVAEEIGAFKPEKKFFDIIMNKIGYTDVSKVAIIGDSLYSDIKGGNNAGIDTFWLNHRGKKNIDNIAVTYEFDNFKKLYSVL